MNWRHYVGLTLLNLLIIILVTNFQRVPGYMDAEYYYLGGIQLVDGKGFSEPILWNYLDNPTGIPHPSHSYWMPLASIASAFSMKLFGDHNFETARLSFIFLSLLIPIITAKLSFKIFGNRKWAIVSGLLAISYGYYLPYINTTDTFSIYMFLGLIFFLLITGVDGKSNAKNFSLGVIVGLMHLSRSDGILWFPIMVYSHLLLIKPGVKMKSNINPFLLSIFGYLLVMIPWVARNLNEFGSILSPGGLRTLWLTNYDRLFVYPSSNISFQTWWTLGLPEILRTRLWAIGINIQRVIAEQGMIFWAPLILTWMWRHRKDHIVRVAFMAWILTFIMMSLIFPYAGARGGLFHSGAALQPLFWVGAPVGLSYFIEWGVNRRNWNKAQATRIFSIALVGFSFILSGFLFYQRVIGPGTGEMIWEESSIHYQVLEDKLQNLGANLDDIVMVKNPPGYYVNNTRKAIVIPDGNLLMLLSAADRYAARYVLLEKDHTGGLENLYQSPENFDPRLLYLGNEGSTLIFEIK